MQKLIGLFVLLLNVLAAPSYAAVSYGYDSGLPNLSANAIESDSDEQIWVGTEDGLSVFNGAQFEVVDLGLLNEQPDQSIITLKAHQQFLYVATRARTLRLHTRERTFETLTFENKNLAHVSRFSEDRNGHVLAFSQDGTIWQSDPHSTKVRAFEFQRSDSITTPIQFTDVYRGNGYFWITASDGLYRLDEDSRRMRFVPVPLPKAPEGRVWAAAVTEFGPNQLWIGYWNDSLLRLNLKTNEMRYFQPGNASAGALKSSSIYALRSRGAELLIATNRGLVAYQEKCDCIRNANITAWDEINGNGVVAQTILPRPDGLWIGTYGLGVTRTGPFDRVFQNFVKVEDEPNSLLRKSVRAMLPLDQSRILISSHGGGLQVFDLAGYQANRTDYFSALPWPLARAESKYIWSLEQTHNGLTIGTGSGLYDKSGETFQAIAPEIESIRCSFTSTHGVQFAGGMLGFFRREGFALKPIALPMADSRVWRCTQVGDEIWLGTDKGLLRLTLEGQVISHHPLGKGNPPSDVTVYEIHQTNQNAVWLGTNLGLFLATRLNSTVTFAMPTAIAKHQVRNVVSIESDRTGQLWLGTTQALIRFNPATNAVQRFARQDGLFGDQFNIKSSARLGDQLVFGGMGGMVVFDPTQLQPSNRTLKPRISQIFLGSKKVSASAHLKLPKNHPPLQLHFSIPDMARPDLLQFAYRWQNESVEFTKLPIGRSIQIERLASGTHQLEMRVEQAGTNQDTTPTVVMQVDVAFAWHQTLWGRLVIALGTMGVIYGIVLLRTKQMLERKRELELEVRLRTTELESASIALRKSNERLQQLAAKDSLTELANRRTLFEQATLWSHAGARLGVLMIDIDHFKQINDQFGHHAGDTVLKAFARMLTDTQAPIELCARYGGEEFVCLFVDQNEMVLEQSAERRLQSLRNLEIPFNNASVKITASVGMAIANLGAQEDFDQLLRRADMALYEAKQGRNQACWAKHA